MPGAWRTVKVFISSTFRDMEAERDHLVRVVFPKLREKLIKRCIHLVDVDLRWGVTSEQDALEVCREIIDDCRPRFLCILGGRYGWTPPGREESITAQEIRYSVLKRLEVKEYRFFYFRDPQVTATIPEAAALAGGYREFPLPEEEAKSGPEEAIRRAQHRDEKLAAIKQEIIAAGYVPFIYPARWDEAQQRLVNLKSFGDQVYADLLWSIDDELGKEPTLELDEFAVENAAMEVFIREWSAGYVVGSRQDLLQEMIAFAEGHGAPDILVITGPSGSGKSALLAKFYRDYLGNEDNPGHPQDLVIPHFIGASPGSTDLRRTLRRFCHEIYHHCDFDSQKQARLSRVTDNDEKAQEKREGIEKEFFIPQDLQELQQQLRNFLIQAAMTRRVVLLIDALNQFDATGNPQAMCWLPYDLPANVRVITSSLAKHAALEALQRQGNVQVRERWLGALTMEDRHAIITGFLYRYRKQMEAEQIASLLGKAESGNSLYLLTALEELRTLGTYEKITQHIKDMPDAVQDLFIWIFKRLENDPGFHDQEGQPLGKKLMRGFASALGVSRSGLSETELAEFLAPGNPESEPPITPDPRGNVAALVRLLRPYLMYRGELLDFYHGQVRQAAESAYLGQEEAYREAHDHLAEYFKQKADPVGDCTWIGQYPRALAEVPYHLAHGRNPAPFLETLADFRFLQAKVKALGVHPLIADYDLAAIPGSNLEADRQAALALIQEALRQSAHVLFQDPGQLAGQLTGRLLGQKSQDTRTFLENIRLTKTEPWLRPLSPTLTPAGGPLRCTLTGHRDWVHDVALWPERGWAVSSELKALKVWDLETGQEIYNLSVHDNFVLDMALWLKRGWAVVASYDHTLRVWDLATGEEVRTLTGDNVPPIALWQERGWVVSASIDNTLKVWDLEMGQELRTLAGHSGAVRSLALWQERGWAVSTSDDHTLKVWDLETGQELRTLAGHSGEVRALALWPEHGWAVSTSDDYTLRVWDLETGREIHILSGHTRPVWTIALWPERGWAVSASEDCTLKVWDLETGQEIHTLAGHSGWVIDVALWPERGWALSASHDHTLKVWDLEMGQELHTLAGHSGEVCALALWPERGWAVSASEDRTLKVWDLKRGQEVHTPIGHNGEVSAVALWPERGWAVSASEDRTLKVWDLETGEERRTLAGHSGGVRALALWPERGWAVSASEDRTLRVWDPETGQELRTLTGYTGSFSAFALWPERGWAVSASKDYSCKVWDLEREQAVRALTQSHGCITDITLWPERGWAVLSSTEDGTLKVWDLVRGQEVLTLEMVCYDAWAKPALWPERGWAVLVSAWGTLNVWDLERGHKVRTFTGDSGTGSAMAYLSIGWERSMEQALAGLLGPVTAVALWPERCWVISAFWNGALKVWDLETEQEVHTLTGHNGPVTGVALWRERGLAVSFSGDALKVWDLVRGRCLATFTGESALTVCAVVPGDTILVAGEHGGRVHFLRLENQEKAPEKPPEEAFWKWVRRVVFSTLRRI